jgi:hypothetical protein
MMARCCAADMLSRTLAWASTVAPAAARAWLPPTWSKCQWVLTTQRTGCGLIRATVSASRPAITS